MKELNDDTPKKELTELIKTGVDAEANKKAKEQYDDIVKEAVDKGEIEEYVPETTAAKLYWGLQEWARQKYNEWADSRDPKEKEKIVYVDEKLLMRNNMRKAFHKIVQDWENQRAKRLGEEPQKILIDSVKIPKGHASCLCDSGKKFKNCCKPRMKRQIRKRLAA